MKDRHVRSAVAIMILFGPLLWLGFLVWVVNLLSLRISYSRLWREHDHMKDLIDQGQKNIRSAAGDSVGDMFEYMSMARKEYLDALEFVLLLGVIPAMSIWFIMALRTTLRAYAAGSTGGQDKA